MKDSTSLMGSPLTVTGVWTVVLILINSVLFKLIMNYVSADVVARWCFSYCIWPLLCERRAMSSAKSRSLSFVRSVHFIPLFLPDVEVLMIQSKTTRMRNCDRKHSCRTPVLIPKLSEISETSFSGTPKCLSILHNVFLSTLSNAFS